MQFEVNKRPELHSLLFVKNSCSL